MSTVQLNWTDNNTDETGHEVYRSTSTINPTTPGTPLATIGSNITTYSDPTAAPGSSYFYRVASVRNSEKSFSSEIQVSIPILNDFTSTALYGLRKLRSSYNDAAIRVRRSSDNAELDIGFTTNGELNTTTLLNFVGNSSGFISWYDQSGNGYHLSNPIAAQQPRIVNNGVLETTNGKPTVVFSGNQALIRDNIPCGVSELWSNIVAKIGSSSTQFERFISLTDSTKTQDWNNTESIILLLEDSPHTAVTIARNDVKTPRQNVIYNQLFCGTSEIFQFQMNLYLNTNKTSISTSNVGNLATNITLCIGSRKNAGASDFDYLTGSISELFLFFSPPNETIRNNLISNQMSYYSIT